MVSSIVGNYLVSKGVISIEQFKDLLAEQRKVRVKLGLIAVAEGLMTQEEADKVNKLQTTLWRYCNRKEIFNPRSGGGAS